MVLSLISIENTVIFAVKIIPSSTHYQERRAFYCKKLLFSMEIEFKTIRKISLKLYNLYFMLEMYSLMLVSMESVCDRF